MSHFIKKCQKCQAVISQCRCMDNNKPVIWGICGKCLQDLQTGAGTNPDPTQPCCKGGHQHASKHK